MDNVDVTSLRLAGSFTHRTVVRYADSSNADLDVYVSGATASIESAGFDSSILAKLKTLIENRYSDVEVAVAGQSISVSFAPDTGAGIDIVPDLSRTASPEETKYFIRAVRAQKHLLAERLCSQAIEEAFATAITSAMAAGAWDSRAFLRKAAQSIMAVLNALRSTVNLHQARRARRLHLTWRSLPGAERARPVTSPPGHLVSSQPTKPRGPSLATRFASADRWIALHA